MSLAKTKFLTLAASALVSTAHAADVKPAPATASQAQAAAPAKISSDLLEGIAIGGLLGIVGLAISGGLSSRPRTEYKPYR